MHSERRKSPRCSSTRFSTAFARLVSSSSRSGADCRQCSTLVVETDLLTLLLFTSGGLAFKDAQLRQLVALASSVISDAGVATPTSSTPSASPNLNEQVVDAIASGSGAAGGCPVQKLILHNSSMSVAHVKALAGALRAPGSALTALVLGNIPLSTAAVVVLADALCSAGRLEQLVLERCSVGSPGAVALAEGLRRARALWKLDLSGNRISDSACPALAEAVVASSSLQLLALSGNALTDRGVLGYLAPALQAAGSAGTLEQVVLRETPGMSRFGRAELVASCSCSSSSSSISVERSIRLDNCMSSSSSTSSTWSGGIRTSTLHERGRNLQIVL